MTFEDHDAVTPVGKPVADPIPVANVVVIVTGVNAEFTQIVEVAGDVAVLIWTIIVPVAANEPQDVKGIE